MEPVTLTGRHVRLEPLSESHHAALSAICGDPDLWRYIAYDGSTPDAMRIYIRNALRARETGDELPFATVHAATGQVVGSSRCMSIHRAHRRVEIGATWLAAPWRRTAINTEAKYLMLRHAFETLGCLRVEFKTDARNQASRAALLRIGAKEEGTLRQHMILWDGSRRDSVYYSILDSEWPAVKAALEGRLRTTG